MYSTEDPNGFSTGSGGGPSSYGTGLGYGPSSTQQSGYGMFGGTDDQDSYMQKLKKMLAMAGSAKAPQQVQAPPAMPAAPMPPLSYPPAPQSSFNVSYSGGSGSNPGQQQYVGGGGQNWPQYGWDSPTGGGYNQSWPQMGWNNPGGWSTPDDPDWLESVDSSITYQ